MKNQFNTGPPSIINRIYGILRDNATSLVNFVIVMTILIIEVTLDKNVFQCPCSHNYTYGLLFLIVPSISLFCLGILANNTTWQLITGCVTRTKQSSHGIRNGCFFMTEVIMRSLVAPFSWTVIGLLDGRYLQCMFIKDQCDTSPANEWEKNDLIARSQVIGFIWLLTGTCLFIIGILAVRACNRKTYEHDRYADIYRKMERHEIERQFEEHALLTAKDNVQAFLEKESRSKGEWDVLGRVPRTPVHMAPKKFQDLNFTPLQGLVLRDIQNVEDLNNSSAENPDVQTQTSLTCMPDHPTHEQLRPSSSHGRDVVDYFPLALKRDRIDF